MHVEQGMKGKFKLYLHDPLEEIPCASEDIVRRGRRL